MGFTVEDQVMTEYGLLLTGLYITVKSQVLLQRYSHIIENKDENNLLVIDRNDRYRLFSTYFIYSSKEAYKQNVRPLKESSIQVQNLGLEDIEKEGGLLKCILYPALKTELGFQNYVDDI